MKIEIVVDRRIERLYEEYMTLIESLRVKTKDERFELYERMTRILYPHATKTVHLEDQLNEDRKDYQRKFKELNFVDTPGHVDFSYEVSRAIASCEGALLLIDASQGVESQTVSNMYMAVEQDLTIVPVVNKIDLPSADIPSVKEQIVKELGLDDSQTQLVSAKTGEGIDELMEAIVTNFPPPEGDVNAPAQALIFDCHYDPYRGVIVHVRVKNVLNKPTT